MPCHAKVNKSTIFQGDYAKPSSVALLAFQMSHRLVRIPQRHNHHFAKRVATLTAARQLSPTSCTSADLSQLIWHPNVDQCTRGTSARKATDGPATATSMFAPQCLKRPIDSHHTATRHRTIRTTARTVSPFFVSKERSWIDGLGGTRSEKLFHDCGHWRPH